MRTLRAERRWSQADLADRCQVSRQTINAIETERYDPGLPLAFTLADIFELTIEEIFFPDRADRADGPDRPAASGTRR
ncbi:putative transcriptional regulator [Parafrankia irregularis]|uniref:Putative transcriptional regulator n=1 Tax=Parafrankia irregularis TaxID=795642 RepID=A0A0S4QW68_9ACTN|nr:helix-turn-helix transcriptional regulator [Parafrankia irregularis]CUU59931.1 putative transcriptional regulator [Parafrankia irregularis]